MQSPCPAIGAARPAPARRKCVLLVDDDMLGLEARKACVQALGFDVSTAAAGAEALATLAVICPDLAVVDYDMPEMNGVELTLKIRAIRPEIPVIMLSGKLIAPEGAAGVVDEFISKGQHPAILLNSISNLLDRP